MLIYSMRLSLVYFFFWHQCFAYTVITQNMAEFSDADPRRIEQLLGRLESQKPDVVFLQEAEARTLRLVRTKSSFSPYRTIYQNDGAEAAGGLIILARKTLSPSSASYIELKSEMYRGLLLATVDMCGKAVTLVNLHLESPDILFWRSNANRRKQIEELKKTLAVLDDFIIAGDFNFVFDGTAEKQIPADWSDAWKVAHPDQPGLTWDPDTNRRAWRSGGFILPGFRLDRILFRSESLKLDEVRMLGVDDVEKLSDHFGIMSSQSCSD